MKNKDIKKWLTLLLLTAGIVVAGCSGNAYQNYTAYNSELMKLIKSNKENIRAMNSVMTKGDYQKAEEVRKTWEKYLNQAIKKAKEIGSFNGDSGLQQAIIEGLKGYRKVVANEYKQLIDIRSQANSSQPAKESKLLKNINQAFTKATEEVNRTVSTFEVTYSE